MKKIDLSQGLFATVDDDDYEKLISFNKWYAVKHRRTFYAKCNITLSPKRRTTLKMHRVIMDAKPGQIVDHINGNGLDNRKCNLRIVDSQKNAINMRSHRKSSSQYKGVSWHKQNSKWQANICVKYQRIYLGIFANEAEAAIAYDRAAVKYFGQYAKLNFPERKECI